MDDPTMLGFIRISDQISPFDRGVINFITRPHSKNKHEQKKMQAFWKCFNVP